MTAWLRPAPGGRPYQQLGRTDVHRWWRPVVALVAMVVMLLAAAVGLMIAVQLMGFAATGDWLEFGTGEDILANDLANLILLLGSIIVMLPVVWAATLVIERRGIGSLSSVSGHLRWRWLLISFVPAAVYMGAVYGASTLANQVGLGSTESDGGRWVGWDAFWPPLLVIVLLVPLQAAAEEYVFRGWMVQAIGSFTFEGRSSKIARVCARVFRTAWPAVLLSAIPFVAGHGYSDWGPVDIGLFAVATGWVVILTGGLEAGIALHIVNNITSMALDASEGDVSMHQGAVPWTDVVVDTLPMLVWAVLVVWMFRQTGRSRPMKRLS
jgi:membrane protease YdiL (CAAX protease family)